MTQFSRFSCYIIGNDDITLQCATVILEKKHQLLGIISRAEKIITWCKIHSIPHLDCVNKLKPANKQFDFLFSIANGEILSPEVLQYPRFYAINYHNSPLPKYAGLYATSWAIYHHEQQHAITWHIMQDKIDTGDILEQNWFAIEEKETALSLNLKCYEQAYQSFNLLVDKLARKELSIFPQSLHGRSYFGLKNKPKNFGFISWDDTASSIERLYRAFTLGHYLNEIASPKIIVNGHVLIVKLLKKSNISSHKKPGRIIALSENHLQISTKTENIIISKLTDLSGSEQDISRLSLSINQYLPSIDESYVSKLYQDDLINFKKERFWVKENLHRIQDKVSFLAGLSAKNSRVLCDSKKAKPITKKTLNKLREISESYKIPPKYFIYATVLMYLFRLNNYNNFSMKHSYSQLKNKIADPVDFLAEEVPFTTSFSKDLVFKEALLKVVNTLHHLIEQGTYCKDIYVRYPELNECSEEEEIHIVFSDTPNDFICKEGSKLTIYIAEDASWLSVHHSMNAPLFKKAYGFLDRACQHISNLLETALTHPYRKIFEFSFLTSQEIKALLSDWNNTEYAYHKKKLLHHYIEEQAQKTPNATAATFEGKSLLYSELNQKSNQLAHYLTLQGITTQGIVGIYLNRSLDMLISILGILKAGAAYLPLDPHYPDKRIHFMLKDSEVSCLITTREFKEKHFKAYHGQIIEISELLNNKDLPLHPPKIKEDAKNLAYIIYTSGTTGNPKGVMISHRSACNHMVWMQQKYNFHTSDVFLQKTPFSFDASVWEFFIPLWIGAKLVIAPPEAHTQPQALIQLVLENKITVLQLVPSMLRELLLHNDFKSCHTLRHLFCGGEALLPEMVRSFFECFSHIKLHNLYGPTETTIDAIASTCTLKDLNSHRSRIGKPIFNTKIYVLDDAFQLVPAGILGELYISGDGLAEGYIHNPDLTQQKFLKNPFSLRKSDKIYKTGDLVKWLSDGSIEYHGRRDSQLKIRGFRVEIDEIESFLEKIPCVIQCMVKPDYQDKIAISLAAYLTLLENSNITAADIRASLRNNIPNYMIPARFFVVDKFFITPSGKLDRQKPLTPIKQLHLTQPPVSPRTAIEKQLHAIWRAVLKKENLSINDDFFELGGHSLIAMQLLVKIQEAFSITTTIGLLFENPTISSLASEIKKLNQSHGSMISDNKLGNDIVVAIKKTGYKPPLFLIHPVGGSVFWYKLLGKYFDQDRPLYGLQDPSLHTQDFIFNKLEDMAAAYLISIKTIQPTGPYLIGGASFGSTVAIEIAKQLEMQGELVSAVILLDGWAEYPALQSNEEHFKALMQSQNSKLLKDYTQNNLPYAHYLLELQWHRENMLMQYQLPRIQSKLILFKAETLSRFFEFEAPLNWWDNYSDNEVELYGVPGDHESMFEEPYVKTLSNRLTKRLSEMDFPHLNNIVRYCIWNVI